MPLVPGDVVRVLALVSVVVGTWWSGPVATALFLLVLGGAMVPRAISAPTVLDVAYCSTILFAAWAAQLDWYVAVGWLDVVVHAVATGLIAVLGVRALQAWARRRTRPPARRDRPARRRARRGAGGPLGAGGVGRERVARPEHPGGVPGHDGDLAAGLAGSVVAAVVVGRRA